MVQHFNDTMKNDPQVIGPSTAVVAIQSLLKLIKESKGRQACMVYSGLYSGVGGERGVGQE